MKRKWRQTIIQQSNEISHLENQQEAVRCAFGALSEYDQKSTGVRPPRAAQHSSLSSESGPGKGSTNPRRDPTFLRMAEATAAAIAAEAAQEEDRQRAERDTSNRNRNGHTESNRGNWHVSPDGTGSASEKSPIRGEQKKITPSSAKTPSGDANISVLGNGLSFGDLNLTRENREAGETTVPEQGLHRVEEEVEDWEGENSTFIDLVLGDLPQWTQGPPAVYASGARISSRVHAWRDEARVQGENASRILEVHENEHAVTASMYKSCHAAQSDPIAPSMRTFAGREKSAGEAKSSVSGAPIICGRSSVELETPGVVLVPQKRPLVMGAASLSSYYNESAESDANVSSRKSAWETVSEANAIVFREAFAEPSRLRDTSRRFDFTHHQNRGSSEGLEEWQLVLFKPFRFRSPKHVSLYCR